MSTVKVSGNVLSAVSGAPDGSSGADAVQNIESMLPPEITVVNWFIKRFTGIDPVNDWVIKPFAGDWIGLSKGSSAWRGAATATRSIQSGLKSFPGQVGDDWQGNTADTWKTANDKLAESLDCLPKECDSLGQLCDALINMGQSLASLVINIITELAARAEQAMAETAIPGVGEVLDAEDILALIMDVINWAQQIQSAITAFEQLVQSMEAVREAFSGCAAQAKAFEQAIIGNYVSAAESVSQGILDGLNTAGQLAQDGSSIIDFAKKASGSDTKTGGAEGTSGGGDSSTGKGGEGEPHTDGASSAPTPEPKPEPKLEEPRIRSEPHLHSGLRL